MRNTSERKVISAKSPWEKQLDEKLRKIFSARLMNNVKWRSIWEIICRLHVRIRIAYAGSHEWNEQNSDKSWGHFTLDCIQERGIRDPGIGGPFLYKEILWVRIPKSHGNDTEAFKREVSQIGVDLFTETDEYVEILGYGAPRARVPDVS
ncbi:MAG: hypothetical protein LBU11_05005 [Zoogloeaceae bacterium]|jgi:hypothetical protein|nr:hypothetical protein [Zoogloeaceae bacterium]